jgi:hypothetical protein
MARIRTIKPEMHTDSKTGTLSDRAYRIFTAALNFADDYGVLSDDWHQLKAQILPHLVESVEESLSPILKELLPRGLWIQFSVEKKGFYWIANFRKHQKIDRPGKPLVDNFFELKIEEKLHATLTDDSEKKFLEFDDDSTSVRRGLAPEGKGREGKGKESKGKEGSLREGKPVDNFSNPVDNFETSEKGRPTSPKGRSTPLSQAEQRAIARNLLEGVGAWKS